MALLVLILLVGVPLIELWVMIEVGSEIGGLAVVALSLLTAGIGLALIRMQGLSILNDLAAQNATGLVPQGQLGRALVHGFFLLVAGFMLAFPGFITDALGALLLVPPVRLMLGKLGFTAFVAKMMAERRSNAAGHGYSPSNPQGRTTIILDGEIVLNDEEPPQTPGSAANSQNKTDRHDPPDSA